MMEAKHLWEVKHNYTCNADGEEFDSWQDFIASWGDADEDMNLLFRFDMYHPKDSEDYGYEGLAENERMLRLNYIHQRKGYISTQHVKVLAKDEPVIRAWLKERFNYLKELWQPIE